MTKRISVIIPTVGRETLAAAKHSCADADEIIVVPDSTGDHGYTPRTKGMAQATGTHLVFLDDDDIFLPGAFDLFREAACDVPVIFKMDHPKHGILWRNRQLEFGNIGTPMLLIPNVPGKLGVWAAHAPGLQEPGGDFTFVSGCVEKMGGPVWREEVVAKVRPDRLTVTVVTPWFNSHDLIPDYKMAMEVGRPDELIVVDNASAPPVDLPGIRLERNAGFSEACNIGLHAAKSDAVLFLNSDIRALRTDWLWRLRENMEPGVLVGAKLCRNMPGHPYLDGWCVGGMRDDLLDLGGFDESLEEPAYWSDNMLCLEARAAGMSLRPVTVGLHHKWSGSTDPSDPKTVFATAANQRAFLNRVAELTQMAA